MIVENDTFEKLEIEDKTYLCAPFNMSDITKTDGGDFQTITIELSNANQSISGLIGTEGDVITGSDCIIEEVFLNEDKEIITQNTFPIFVGQANNLILSMEKITFDIEAVLGGYVNCSPNMTYGVMCQWRKFKDARCGYTGEETACDKTYTRCTELSNTSNFGGFPSLPREQVIKVS